MAVTPSPIRSDSTASVASSTISTASSSAPTALPTEEALQTLLSPDGYYKYLSIPKPSPHEMGLKYQEAMAAGGAPVDKSEDGIDLDQVKKNYRRLSLRHHPDRPTGDAEAFRMLNRAKVVLSSPKLRREYDLVGLDLEDDEEQADHEDGDATTTTTSANTDENGEESKEAHHEDAKDGNSSKTETVMGHLASAALGGVLQIAVRTGLMGIVSVLISRYTILTFLGIGMLVLLTTKMYSAMKKSLAPNVKPTFSKMKEAFSPLVIAFGVYCMYRGRRFLAAAAAETEAGTIAKDSTVEEVATYLDWSWTFWFGESLVMTMFISNSFEQKPPALMAVFTIASMLLSLWLRGLFWRYATLLGFEGIIAVLIMMAFPIMEMILESIVEEKMKKIGEKIRLHDRRMKELLEKKRREREGS